MQEFRQDNPKIAMVSSPTLTLPIIFSAVFKTVLDKLCSARDFTCCVYIQWNILLLQGLCKIMEEITRSYGLSCELWTAITDATLRC